MEPTDKRIPDVEQWEALAGVINGNVGKAKVLTSADYNWPVDNPASVALWLLEPGTYCKNDASIIVRYGTTSASGSNESLVTFIVGKNNTTAHILVHRAASSGTAFLKSVVTNVTSGAVLRELDLGEINDTLTSTSVERPLSAKQGKVLKDLIDGLVISGAGAPTTSTVGTVGKLYEDTTNGKLYQCTAVSGSTYTWEEVGAGGSGGGVTELTSADYNYHSSGSTDDGVALWLLDAGVYVVPSSESLKIYYGSGYATESGVSSEVYIITPASGSTKAAILITPRYSETLVTLRYTNLTTGACTYEMIPNITQTTGTSTTVVMSQNAVTSMVFADPTQKQKVQIGNSSNASGANSIGIGVSPNATSRNAVAIGSSATAAHDESIALGFGATTSAAGEMNIGAGTSGRGYNSSNYRLLTGLYDPQSAHDAATKGYVDGLVGNIAAALNAINNGGGN